MRRSQSRPRFWCGSSADASRPQLSARLVTAVAVALLSATLASAACSGSERPAHAEPPPSAPVQRERNPLGASAYGEPERETPRANAQVQRRRGALDQSHGGGAHPEREVQGLHLQRQREREPLRGTPSAREQGTRGVLGPDALAATEREREAPSASGQGARGASGPEAVAATQPERKARDARAQPKQEATGEGGAQTQLHACSASPIPASTQQLVVVTSAGFDAWHATLQRFEREDAAAGWRKVGEPTPVVLGRAGYAWGDGLHGSGAPAGRSGPVKREGDMRSPAGIFALGTVHGYAPAAPSGMSLPYRQANAALRCVDDPRSTQYNRIVEPGAHGETWSSAERMRRDDAAYELALDIEHNRSPVVAGHGSCIFAHVWVNAETPVAGCTGMALSMLRQVLTWIKPGALWVALPAQEYEALRACWSLPDRLTH